MISMSRKLRLLWAAYTLFLVGAAGLALGPTIEGKLFPIRTGQKLDEPGRDASFLHFTWVNRKERSAAFVDVDLALESEHDRFVETLYSDDSAPGDPPCTKVLPWARSRVVDVGPHRQPLCVEIPRTVGQGERLKLTVVVRYGGLWGLWQIPVALPVLELSGTTQLTDGRKRDAG